MIFQKAVELLKAFNPDISEIKSHFEDSEYYFFIAYTSDPLEGRMLPFYRVNKVSGYASDFSPSDYPDPLALIQKFK